MRCEEAKERPSVVERATTGTKYKINLRPNSRTSEARSRVSSWVPAYVAQASQVGDGVRMTHSETERKEVRSAFRPALPLSLRALVLIVKKKNGAKYLVSSGRVEDTGNTSCPTRTENVVEASEQARGRERT